MTDGVLVIDKPRGPTSHDVVAIVRRVLGLRRVGHTGTLDPAATGVLPIVLGRATRLARFLSGSRKTYLAHVRLGITTDTYDAEGQIQPASPRQSPAELTREAVEAALEAFRGTFLQEPPPFSAKKIDGVRAYDLARRQQPVHPAPVSVTVHKLELCDFVGDEIVLRVTCSAGFYVRSLAHHLGARLGTGGHLAALRRTESAGFGEDAALPLADLQAATPAVLSRIVPLDRLLPDMPAATLNASGLAKVAQGRDLGAGDVIDWPAAAWSPRSPRSPQSPWFRVLDGEAHLVAVAEPRGVPAVLHPSVVLK